MLIDDLRAGRLDAAIGFCTDVPGDLHARRLKDVPVVAVLPAAHPLATREIVALPELRGDTFVLADEDDSPGYNAAVRDLCRHAGFEPAIRSARADLGAWEDTIVRAGCVGLTGRSAVQTTRAGVHAIPLEPSATLAVDLLWQPSAPAERPPLNTFLALAAQVAREQHWLDEER